MGPESKPGGGGEIFSTRLDRPWGPPIVLCNDYRLSFPGVKRPGHGVDHPSSSSVKVKGRLSCGRVNFAFAFMSSCMNDCYWLDRTKITLRNSRKILHFLTNCRLIPALLCLGVSTHVHSLFEFLFPGSNWSSF